jgi:hypothetical protein
VGEWRLEARAYQQDSDLAGTAGQTFKVRPGDNSLGIMMRMAGPCYVIDQTGLLGGTVNFTHAFAGTTISLIPDPGRIFVAGSGKYSAPGSPETPIDGSSFSMPASDITISAEFAAPSDGLYSMIFESLRFFQTFLNPCNQYLWTIRKKKKPQRSQRRRGENTEKTTTTLSKFLLCDLCVLRG